MRVAALAVDEEGEEEDEDEAAEEKVVQGETREEQGGHAGHYGARGLAMCPPATVGDRSRWSVVTCPIFFVPLLLLLLLPGWIMTIVVDASPLHPALPHKGESRLPFFVDSLG